MYTYDLRELKGGWGISIFLISITTTKEEYRIWLAETVHKNT